MEVKVNPSESVPLSLPNEAPQIDALKAVPPVVRDGVATITLTDGRKVGIKKMGPLDRMRMSSLIGSDDSKNELYLSNAVPAYCVTTLEGAAVPRATQKFALEAFADRLGDKALLEITLAIAEYFPEADLTQIVNDFKKRQELKN